MPIAREHLIQSCLPCLARLLQHLPQPNPKYMYCVLARVIM